MKAVLRHQLLGATLLSGVGMAGAMMMATRSVEDMQAEQVRLREEAQALYDLAENENRDNTEAELTTINSNLAQVEALDGKITLANRLAPKPANPGQNRQTRDTTNQQQNRNGQSAQVQAGTRGNWGFTNFGEYALTVRAAGGDAPDQTAVNRLQNALTTFGSEGTGADGGFLVPPDFRRDIAVKVTGDESLLPRTDRMITSSNALVLPKDETTPYGTTGIQAYWESEAGQKTQSKPVFGTNQMRLHKLIALVPVTDELLEDAPAMDAYLRRKTPEVMTAKINSAIVGGTGAGQPLGFLRAPSLITVSKESSQPADSIWFRNIVNMYSRMRAVSLPRSVWLINQSILPQLFLMAFDPAATAGKVPVYLPANGAADAPFGTLFGRPIVPIEAMSAVGDLGDIAFVDLSQYITVTKGNDIRTDVSIHLFFDYDVTAFRFVFRITGQPMWSSAVTSQASGAPTTGHFITLAERA